MYACAINGQQCSPEQATISVMDHGLLYGDGVFEGLRFYSGNVFKLTEHLDRLKDSAAAIGLTLPMTHDQLRQSIRECIDASQLDDGYIRLIVTRGVGSLGLDPKSCSGAQTIILVDKLSIVDDLAQQRGATLIISSVRRLDTDQIDPRIKSLNYLNQILAKQEANAVGVDEAILLNRSGRVAEGSADNIFIVKQGQLQTPPTSEGALAGITRQAIIDIAQQLGIDCNLTPLTTYDLYTADECFLTGTGAELIPVASISGHAFDASRPVYTILQDAFQQLVRSNPSASVAL